MASGRNRLTIWAVMPPWLTVRMASAPMSSAVVQAAWAVAAVTDRWVWAGSTATREQSMLLSVLRAMASMVLTASTGYLPAAVSPESMIALVPS